MMDPAIAARLGDQAAQDQRNVVASQAAADRATREGRPQVARVLRAVAASSRARALVLERLAAGDAPSIDRLGAEREHQHHAAVMLAELILAAETAGERALASVLSQLLSSTRSAARLLDAAALSLVRHDDVVHPDVPSQLWVCTSCGHLFGPMAMEQCELCAAPASEHDCYQ